MQTLINLVLIPLRAILFVGKGLLSFVGILWGWLVAFWGWFCALPAWGMALVAFVTSGFAGLSILFAGWVVWLFGYIFTAITTWLYNGAISLMELVGDAFISMIQATGIDISGMFTSLQVAQFFNALSYIGHIVDFNIVASTAVICITLCMGVAMFRLVIKLIPGVG